jgi:hypothetical protein
VLLIQTHVASAQILLDEPGTEMDIYLDQRLVTDTGEAVDLPGLDDQDVARAGLKLPAVDLVETPSISDELDFVIGMAMRARPAAGQGIEEKYRDADVALIGADELVRAALEGEILLTHAVHC